MTLSFLFFAQKERDNKKVGIAHPTLFRGYLAVLKLFCNFAVFYRFLDSARMLSCPPPRLAGTAGAGESRKGGSARNDIFCF